MAHIIDGRKWAAVSRQETASAVAELVKAGVRPGLAVVLIGEHPASLSYVSGKEKAAAEVGIHSQVLRLPAETSEEEVLNLIALLNADRLCHGILVQLPLPAHISESVILDAISPQKDVDGFHAQNVGALALGKKGLIPCTPLGVMQLLAYEGIAVRGAHAVIIGRSHIVGKPMAQLLLQANATVTVCHSHTRNLQAITRQADILVAAIGRPLFVKADMVKVDAVVIDVGINRVEGKLCGDVDFAAVSTVAAAITPVPRGVGPMTIAMLLRNTVQAARESIVG